MGLYLSLPAEVRKDSLDSTIVKFIHQIRNICLALCRNVADIKCFQFSPPRLYQQLGGSNQLSQVRSLGRRRARTIHSLFSGGLLQELMVSCFSWGSVELGMKTCES